MADALWRLLWALPAVLVVGALALALLRRLNGMAPRAEVGGRFRLVESLDVSGRTRAYLVEADARVLVVLEGDGQLVAHWMPSSDQANMSSDRRRRGLWPNVVRRTAR